MHSLVIKRQAEYEKCLARKTNKYGKYGGKINQFSFRESWKTSWRKKHLTGSVKEAAEVSKSAVRE